MPEGWVARRTDEGVVIIEGAPRTEPYEMTIRLSFFDKKANTLETLSGQIKAALAALPEASVSTAAIQSTTEGRPARAHMAAYSGKDAAGRQGPFKQMVAVIEYADHLIVLGYFGPAALFDKYMPAFELVGSTLRAR